MTDKDTQGADADETDDAEADSIEASSADTSQGAGSNTTSEPPSATKLEPSKAAILFGMLRARLFGWYRREVKRQTRVTYLTSKIPLIGPTQAGKSALIASLEKCKKAETHSYASRFTVNIKPKNDAYSAYVRQVDRAIEDGFAFDATNMAVSDAQFTVTAQTIKDNNGHIVNDVLSADFTIYDTSGSLILRQHTVDDAKEAARNEQHREQFYQHLRDSEACIIFLPFAPWGVSSLDPDEYVALNKLISDFRDDPGFHKIKRIVLCLTKYEINGSNLGRKAYRTLANPDIARKVMHKHLTESPGIRDLQPALSYFHTMEGRSVWCSPVSPFGFVGGNGGPNYDPTSGLIRTYPAKAADPTSSRSPYTLNQVMDDYWRPFLTLDPLLFIITKIHEDTLTMPLDRVLQT